MRDGGGWARVIEKADAKLTVVMFAGHDVPELRRALFDAVERGVDVHFVVESPVSGKVDFDPKLALGSERLAKATVWTRPVDQRPRDEHGHHGTRHAKLALADRHRLLVSSANFAGHAMRPNVEMSVMIEGGTLPKSVADHLDRLMLSDVLVRASHVV